LELKGLKNLVILRSASIIDSPEQLLGSFVADKTNSQFTKGGKWLVWKYEIN
jgi:hypothetical protein